MKNYKRTKLDIVGEIYNHIIGRYQQANKQCRVIKSDVAYIVDDFLEEMKASMVGLKTVELRGFGTFQVKKRAGKKNSRNPRSGELVETVDHYVPVFKPGVDLKDAVRGLDKDKGV